jgi:hypothetical protein
MTGADIAMAVVFFVAGIATGVIVLASLGILREERVFLRTGLVSVTRRAPGRVSNSARSLTGLYVGQRTDPDREAATYLAATYEDTLV